MIIDNNLDGSTLELSKNAFDCEKSALLQQERLTAYDNWVLDSYSTQSDYFPKSDDDRTFSRDLISGVEVEYEARSAESVRNTTEIAAAQQSCGFQGQTDYSKGSWHLENGLLINTETGEFRDANYDRIQDLYKRYALQETASNILGRHRVGFCMRGVGFNKSNVRIHRRDVENSNIKQANYKGLAHCANVRGCTVCAGLIGQHRAEEIRHGFDYAKDHNLTVQMLTVTIRHTSYDSPIELSENIRTAWRETMGHRAYKKVRDACGVVGYIKSLEVTHGDNGLHPHFHLIYLSKKGLDENFRSEVMRLWQDWFLKKGLPFPADTDDKYIWLKDKNGKPIKKLKRGFKAVQLQDGSAASEYVNKHHELKTNGDSVRWDMADEVSKHYQKKGRKKSRSMFEVLEDAHFGDKHSAFLFKEYIEAFHGASSLEWSKGLKKIVGLDDIKDKELVSKAHGDAKFWRAVPADLWNELLKRRKTFNRVKVLELSQNENDNGIKEYFANVLGKRICDISKIINNATIEEKKSLDLKEFDDIAKVKKIDDQLINLEILRENISHLLKPK